LLIIDFVMTSLEGSILVALIFEFTKGKLDVFGNVFDKPIGPRYNYK
jgi:hypothetical protein